MKKGLFLFFCFLILRCSNTQNENLIQDKVPIDSIKHAIVKVDPILENQKFDSLSSGLAFISGKNYSLEKSKILKKRDELSLELLSLTNQELQTNLLDSVSLIFTDFLLNHIIPHWYETAWDFNGHTAIPKQGEIACGYFVSTTLKDMGLKLNRYKLAQQNPKNEAKTIAIDTIEMFEVDDNKTNEFLNKLKDGLYFIGLDNHVGYLYLYKNQTYFIHSNYIEGKVMVEYTYNSKAFYSTKYFISKISENKILMKKWLNQSVLPIISD